MNLPYRASSNGRARWPGASTRSGTAGDARARDGRGRRVRSAHASDRTALRCVSAWVLLLGALAVMWAPVAVIVFAVLYALGVWR